MGFKPPPKRKKVDGAPSVNTFPCTPVASSSEKKDVGTTPVNKPTVHEVQSSSASLRIQQARNHAVSQAQQDGCNSNFRIFDSPYGNYLVPVIPSRAELGI